MMTQKETAVDIIKTYFPEELSKAIDTRTLRIFKDTFIDEQNAENESDILYEVMMNGQEAYIYLLFEHKSYGYKFTALQLLK
jgi:predicted transposase YdaD